jgi:hypothetical protein
MTIDTKNLKSGKYQYRAKDGDDYIGVIISQEDGEWLVSMSRGAIPTRVKDLPTTAELFLFLADDGSTLSDVKSTLDLNKVINLSMELDYGDSMESQNIFVIIPDDTDPDGFIKQLNLQKNTYIDIEKIIADLGGLVLTLPKPQCFYSSDDSDFEKHVSIS